LRGDDPAAGPLIAPVLAGEGDARHDAVAVDDGGPHVEADAGVFFGDDGLQGGDQFSVRGQIFKRAAVFALALGGEQTSGVGCHREGGGDRT